MDVDAGDPASVNKNPIVIKAAQRDVGKLDVLVCGSCFHTYHFVEAFQEHKSNHECGDPTFKPSLTESKPQVWAFLLWKSSIINQRLKDGVAANDNINSWVLYQKWCKMDEKVRDAWISAGRAIQGFSTIAHAKIQEVPSAKNTETKPKTTSAKTLGLGIVQEGAPSNTDKPLLQPKIVVKKMGRLLEDKKENSKISDSSSKSNSPSETIIKKKDINSNKDLSNLAGKRLSASARDALFDEVLKSTKLKEKNFNKATNKSNEVRQSKSKVTAANSNQSKVIANDTDLISDIEIKEEMLTEDEGEGVHSGDDAKGVKTRSRTSTTTESTPLRSGTVRRKSIQTNDHDTTNSNKVIRRSIKENKKMEEEAEEGIKGGSEEEEEYVVEKILAKRFNPKKKCFEYLLKWEGYPHEQNTWEPVDNMQACDKLVETFENNLTKQKAMQQQKIAAKAEPIIAPPRTALAPSQKANQPVSPPRPSPKSVTPVSTPKVPVNTPKVPVNTPKVPVNTPKVPANTPKVIKNVFSTPVIEAGTSRISEISGSRPVRSSKKKAMEQVKSWCGSMSKKITSEGGKRKADYSDSDEDDDEPPEKRVKEEPNDEDWSGLDTPELNDSGGSEMDTDDEKDHSKQMARRGSDMDAGYDKRHPKQVSRRDVDTGYEKAHPKPMTQVKQNITSGYNKSMVHTASPKVSSKVIGSPNISSSISSNVSSPGQGVVVKRGRGRPRKQLAIMNGVTNGRSAESNLAVELGLESDSSPDSPERKKTPPSPSTNTVANIASQPPVLVANSKGVITVDPRQVPNLTSGVFIVSKKSAPIKAGETLPSSADKQENKYSGIITKSTATVITNTVEPKSGLPTSGIIKKSMLATSIAGPRQVHNADPQPALAISPKPPTPFPKLFPTSSPTLIPASGPKLVATSNSKFVPASSPKLVPTSSPKLVPTSSPPKHLPNVIPKLTPTSSPMKVVTKPTNTSQNRPLNSGLVKLTASSVGLNKAPILAPRGIIASPRPLIPAPPRVLGPRPRNISMMTARPGLGLAQRPTGLRPILGVRKSPVISPGLRPRLPLPSSAMSQVKSGVKPIQAMLGKTAQHTYGKLSPLSQKLISSKKQSSEMAVLVRQGGREVLVPASTVNLPQGVKLDDVKTRKPGGRGRGRATQIVTETNIVNKTPVKVRDSMLVEGDGLHMEFQEVHTSSESEDDGFDSLPEIPMDDMPPLEPESPPRPFTLCPLTGKILSRAEGEPTPPPTPPKPPTPEPIPELEAPKVEENEILKEEENSRETVGSADVLLSQDSNDEEILPDKKDIPLMFETQIHSPQSGTQQTLLKVEMSPGGTTGTLVRRETYIDSLRTEQGLTVTKITLPETKTTQDMVSVMSSIANHPSPNKTVGGISVPARKLFVEQNQGLNSEMVTITGDDGVVYQIATDAQLEGSEGEQQCVYVTSDQADGSVLTLDTAVAEAVAQLIPDQSVNVLGTPGGSSQFYVKEGDDEASGGQLMMLDHSGEETLQAQVVAQVVQEGDPAPGSGGTRRVVLMLPDGNLMMTEVDEEQYAALDLEH
uniref:Chromo domain-containing protein n=1 Tax=Timema tahoe TaxID=61484 RepID=A0A7R9IC20_9NEOP|nr:unnamed protein product [Timema tahoe]